ncbi:hypothetical protein V1505DRAFT_367899 [Lipomyces doorenjongii]
MKQWYKKAKRLPGTTTIIGMKNSRKCGLTYSTFLKIEIEDVETVDNLKCSGNVQSLHGRVPQSI